MDNMDNSFGLPTPPADQIGGVPQLAMDRAKADDASSAVDKSQAELTSLAQKQAGEISGREQQLTGMEANQPQNMVGFAMKQSPILMALAALAGGHSRTFGLTALGSLNGMVQGVQAGSEKQYQDAEKKYQQALQMMQERWKIQNDVYNSLEKAYGNTLNGNLRRWQIANAAVGNDERIAQDTFTQRMDIAKFYQTAQGQEETRKERISHDIEIEDIARMNAGAHQEDADTRRNKPAAGSAKAKEADDFSTSMESKIDEAIKLISLHPGTTGLAGKGRSIKETVAGSFSNEADSSAHLVDQKLTQLQADVVKLAGMRPGIKSMEEMANVVGSQGWGSSDANVLAKLKSLKDEIHRDKNGGKMDGDVGIFAGPVAPVGELKQVPDMSGNMVTVKSLGNGKWQQQN